MRNRVDLPQPEGLKQRDQFDALDVEIDVMGANRITKALSDAF